MTIMIGWRRRFLTEYLLTNSMQKREASPMGIGSGFSIIEGRWFYRVGLHHGSCRE
jgi:hypothetical protein